MIRIFPSETNVWTLVSNKKDILKNVDILKSLNVNLIDFP